MIEVDLEFSDPPELEKGMRYINSDTREGFMYNGSTWEKVLELDLGENYGVTIYSEKD